MQIPPPVVVTWTYVGWMLISTVGGLLTVQTTFEGVSDRGLSTENGQPVNVQGRLLRTRSQHCLDLRIDITADGVFQRDRELRDGLARS